MNYEWLGRLVGLENVKSIQSVDRSFAAGWAHNYPVLVLIGCAALSALSIWFYRNYQPGTHRRVRAALAVSRALVLSLLLVFLADPVLSVKFSHSPRPLLWVLFDGTDSMNIQDELSASQRAALAKAVGLEEESPGTAAQKTPASLSRADYVRHWVKKKQDNVLAKLSEKFRLKAFVFDRTDGVRSLEWNVEGGEQIDPARVDETLTANGQVTALGNAFEDLAQRHATGNLAGLVVISDFDQNAGSPPLAKAESLRRPVYTIGVGPAEAVDLGVDLQAPLLMKKAERSAVNVTLRQSGLKGQSVDLSVTARKLGGDATPGEILIIGHKTIQLDSAATPVEFPFTPDETGRFEFIAEVPPLAGEVVEQNNRSTREVNIRDDFLRLMFIEYEPTWEWRFIKEVFHRDKLVGQRGFRTFLRSSDPKVRTSNELFLPTLTPQRSEFFANDVIFLGDMPKAALNTRFCEMVKEFVDTFGGGLVVMAGPRFGPGQLADTALADMLPVVVDKDARIQDKSEFHLQLAPAADQFDFMQLGGDEAENQKAWNNLGPLPWYQPVARLHPLGASILAQHPTDTCVDGKTKQPLVAIRRYGRGEVVYLGFNETWRLRRKYGELYYRQFWGQMIHRLGLSHALGSQKRFVVRTDQQQYRADDKAILTVEAYNANFEPLTEDDVSDRRLAGELIVPGRPGEVELTEPISIPQLREGVFETRIPVSQGGEYHVRVKDPVTEDYSEISFQVTSLSAERRSAVRNVSLQHEIAQATGGKAYDLENAARLPDEIKLEPISETSIRVFPLWDTWLGFGLVVALMLGEWLARKLINLA